MSDYDVTKDHQSPGPGEPSSAFGQTPGVDPRIERLKEQGSLGSKHTNPQSIIDAEPGETVEVTTPTLTSLIDRLEHLYSFAAGLQGDVEGINDKLAGALPRDDKVSAASDKPDSLLAYAHDVASDIDRRLHKINNEFKRLHNVIGK